MESLKLMCVLAHPDDESLGMGGILAKYAAEGVETYLVTATRGEYGWHTNEEDYPGPTELGLIREQELYAAAEKLGLKEVHLLDYVDSCLDEADHQEAVDKIVSHIRRVQPQIIVTFDPFGAYGHPDHIAVSQFTTAAVVAAADSVYVDSERRTAHRVDKLYFRAEVKAITDIYEAAFGKLVMHVDGEERQSVSWQPWAVSAVIDTSACWSQVWDAIRCHRTQLPGYNALLQLPVATQQKLWERQHFYRAFSLVNGGRQTETDLFSGVREMVFAS